MKHAILEVNEYSPNSLSNVSNLQFADDLKSTWKCLSWSIYGGDWERWQMLVEDNSDVARLD